MKVSPQARKQNPSLPEYWYARAVSYELNGVEKTVLTSLPADRYPAKAVAELYHCRWEIEVGFRNIKSSLQNNALVLRSRKVELLHRKSGDYCWLTTLFVERRRWQPDNIKGHRRKSASSSLLM